MDYQALCEKIAEKKVEYYKAVGVLPNAVEMSDEAKEVLIAQYVEDFGVNPGLPLQVMGLKVDESNRNRYKDIIVYRKECAGCDNCSCGH